MKIPIKKGFLGNQRRITMMMDLSSTCDILCKQCFRTVLIPKSAKVSTDQIGILEREVFPYIDRLALSCTGEPLTLRNFKEGLKAAKRAEVPFIRIQSNGTHLSEEMSEFLIDEGLTHLGISLDGATKETFETVRNGAHWDEVIGNIRTFTRLRRERQSSSPSLCLNFTLMKENAEEAVSFIPFAVGLGADSVSFSHLILESWEMKEWSLLYDAPRMNALLADLREEAKKYNIPSHIPADVPDNIIPFDGQLIEDVPTHSGPCSAAEEDWMFMLPNGDIFACGNLQDQGPLGNVFQTPLKEIWLGARNQNFRRNALNGCVEGCDHCKIFASSADPSHEMSYLARRLTSRAAAEMDFESVHRRREPSSSAQTAPAHS
ncbi:MAG: radical SAM protein [Candidatus Omnitrophica bacterium]|nr:radical SAM protein [Candidatus Omnitrophota bacterium]